MQVKPCQPTCGITASPLPAKAGKPFTVDVSGSRVAAGVKGGVKSAKVEVVDPNGAVVGTYDVAAPGFVNNAVVIKKGGIHTLRAVVVDEAVPAATVVDVVRRSGGALLGGVALVRIEQLYPFPAEEYQRVLARYPQDAELVWCQEEPQNQGAWFFVQHYVHENMFDGQKLGYAGRSASASPSVPGVVPGTTIATGTAATSTSIATPTSIPAVARGSSRPVAAPRGSPTSSRAR